VFVQREIGSNDGEKKQGTRGNSRLKFFFERKATANGAKLCDLNSLSGAGRKLFLI
jgi:hypothetical protein